MSPLEERFQQLRNLERSSGGALTQFARERPYLYSLLKRIGEREKIFREWLLFPATRPPGVTTDYLAGALLMCGVIKQTIATDNSEAKDFEFLRKAENDLFGGSDASV